MFFFSGFAAIIYQIVWQRLLFVGFGTNIESITTIVSVFMFGLGLGALFGGYLSRKFNSRLLHLFIVLESAIGVFGFASYSIIKTVSATFLDFPDWVLPIVIFGLLCIPTIAMGGTLPILITHLFHSTGSVGASVSRLYFINTLGSAIGCVLTVGLLFVLLSLPQVLLVAAGINLGVAASAYLILSKR